MKRLAIGGVLAVVAGLAPPALAEPAPVQAVDAECFTTDDGRYPCRFESGPGGSFEISAPGYPTFRLVVDAPGMGFASGQFEPDGRFVPLPGTFLRSDRDPACWVSDATEAEICAW